MSDPVKYDAPAQASQELPPLADNTPQWCHRPWQTGELNRYRREVLGWAIEEEKRAFLYKVVI